MAHVAVTIAGRREADNLRRRYIEAALAAMHDAGQSHRSIHQAAVVLNTALGVGPRTHITRATPVTGCNSPTNRPPPRPDTGSAPRGVVAQDGADVLDRCVAGVERAGQRSAQVVRAEVGHLDLIAAGVHNTADALDGKRDDRVPKDQSGATSAYA